MRPLVPAVKLSILTFALGLSIKAWGLIHVVQKHETLSQISGKYVVGPVWGKQGSLVRLQALNPQIEDVNKIYPGQAIVLDGDRRPAQDLTQAPIIEDSPAPEPSPSMVPSSISTPIPAPAATPSAIVQAPPPEFQRGSEITLAPYYAITGISLRDSVGGTSLLASKWNVGASLIYAQNWTEHSQSFIGLKLSYFEFDPPSDTRKSLNPSSQILGGLIAGANFKLSDRFELLTYATYQREIFARVLSSTSVVTDAVLIPGLGARGAYDLLKLRPFTLGVAATVELKLPAKIDAYDVRFGTTVGGFLYLRQDLREGASNVQTELGIFSRSQNTSLVEQTQTDLTLSVKFFLDGK